MRQITFIKEICQLTVLELSVCSHLSVVLGPCKVKYQYRKQLIEQMCSPPGDKKAQRGGSQHPLQGHNPKPSIFHWAQHLKLPTHLKSTAIW